MAQFVLFGVIAALVTLPAIFGGGGAYRRLLAHPLLTWMGLISYGIFLWQFPVMILLLDHTDIANLSPRTAFPILTLATLAVTIALATLSYYGLERPVMRWVRRRSPRGGRRRRASPLERPLGPETPASG